MEDNYRSTQEILDLANWLLDQSPLNYRKKLRAVRGHGIKPRLIDMESEWDEANSIAQDILARRGRGADWGDHMVLIRSRYSGRQIEVAFLTMQIPFRFIGGTSLMQSAHVRDVTSLLRLVANSHDEIAWMRYLMLWPGVGDKTAADIVASVLDSDSLKSCLDNARNHARLPLDAVLTVEQARRSRILRWKPCVAARPKCSRC